jgi:hypothetical protein
MLHVFEKGVLNVSFHTSTLIIILDSSAIIIMTTSRPHRMISDLDFTKTQLAVFVVILLLAVDTIK